MHRYDDRFLKEVGTTEVARDSLKMDVNKPASWSTQDLRTRPVIPGLADHRCSVCCFLTRWSAESRWLAESHCRHCIQSGRRRCLTIRPATDLLSPLRRIYFQRNRCSSVPATCVESHWAENRFNSLPISEFSCSNCTTESIARCFVLAHVSRQKTGVVCGSVSVNHITDCSVMWKTHGFWFENVRIEWGNYDVTL